MAPKRTMASSSAATPGETSKGLPRNSSIDTAISAISSTLPSNRSSPQLGQQQSADIAGLIKTAGSAEAVIQHLLKEKHSQSQQNTQLWRLVDKQRAMILGLNKDLEAALKDKEKYRKKLKEFMSNPAVLRAAGGQQHETEREGRRGPVVPRVDVHAPSAQGPDSPSLDSDSQKNSPVDISMAPYPITPPADRLPEPPSAVGELLDPKHSMPKPQEHARGKFDHEADDKVADQAWKDKSDEQLKEIPFNFSLPPSRSLPSGPPNVPPPKPPSTAHPSVTVMEPTPQPDEGLSMFPSPPRKPPPAPLQLKKHVRRDPAPAEEDDTESDYDDILEVDETADKTKRGRRRTREEDDRDREVIAFREAQERSTSKKSKSSKSRPPGEQELPPSPKVVLAGQSSNGGTASLDAVLQVDKRTELVAPLHSPGLPLSPRPMGNSVKPGTSTPLSPRSEGPAASAPLSPRPPRQPIPLPPNTAHVSPSLLSSSSASSVQLPDANRRTAETLQKLGSAKGRSGRTKIFKGLVTEEYPDLLLPPNALPSIEVKVASSRMKPSRASLISLTQLEEDPVFTLAITSRADHGELWRVEKDITSLSKLDQRLKQCSSVTARTPDRSLFSGHAPAKLDMRRVALEQYLDELLDTPLDTPTAMELCRYLSTNTLPPYADETGSAVKGVYEHSAHKVGPDGRPIRSGYLTKKGKNFGGWKARYFMIEGPQLKYYETPGGAHLGTIKLQNAQIGKQSQSAETPSPASGPNGEELDNQYRHAFLILEPKKKDSSSHVKHVLCAESDKERDLWVDVLLQCIDYRDPNDTSEPQNAKSAAAQDRHEPAGPEHPSGGRSKKSNQTKSQHQAAGSDSLIGVRYDSTHAGETPQGAPGAPKGSAGLPEHSSSHNLGGDTMSSQTNKMISGPKDPQVISDSAAWGNKSGLAIPTNEEKKQRKRSFFGFGPKTRSSSDGQDSLFGGSETGSGATPPQNSYHGPVRQVFGAPLAEAVRFSPPADVNVPLPSVVYRCIQYLDSKDAILEEGIFRLSGSNVVIKQLRERFNTEGDINLVTDEQYYDIHAVASLLKLYLRELPTTILTRDLHLEFLSTTEMQDRKEKVAALSELAQRLPQANATLLKYLISFLIKIINNADMNRMNVRNVGIVFSPTLNIPAPVFAMFLQNYEGIFGIDPEHYELPSLMPESDSQQGRVEAAQRFDPPAARPSTSPGGSSPHRQPRMDSVRDHPRMTPTPPLLMNLQTARGSPTPPTGPSRQYYDPGYHAQYSTGSSGAPRPAYESGYGLPAGLEGHNYHAAQRAVPGYDRPVHASTNEDNGGGSQSHDQQQSMNAKRRESSVLHQGSKSRLREEARF